MKYFALLLLLLFASPATAATQAANCAADGAHTEVYNTALNKWTCVSITSGGSSVSLALTTSNVNYDLGVTTSTSGTLTTLYAVSGFNSNPSTGVFTLPSALSISTTGSTIPTNGMYSAVANALRFSTSGASALSITSTGGVGIGTTTPAAKLYVAGGNIAVNQDGNVNDTVLIGDIGSTFPGIWFGANSNAPTYTNYAFLWDPTIGTLINAPVGTAGMTFRISNAAVMAANTHGVAIGFGDASATVPAAGNELVVNGNVGIGNSAPTQMLGVGVSNSFTVSSSGAVVATAATVGGVSSSVTVTGTGSPSPNGTYSFGGIFNGRVYYNLGSSWFIFWNNTNWVISAILGNASNCWFFASLGATPPSTAGWTAFGTPTGSPTTSVGPATSAVIDVSGAVTTGGPLSVNGILSVITTSSTKPTNGVYSPAANQLALTTSGNTALTMTSTGAVGATGPISTGGYTVSTLPVGTIGMRAYVIDQLGACVASGAALTGGGSGICPVFYGASWVGD